MNVTLNVRFYVRFYVRFMYIYTHIHYFYKNTLYVSLINIIIKNLEF
jgi:hypothetical protein